MDKTEDCGSVEVSLDRATEKDIQQEPSADPENTQKLLAVVQKDSEPPYRTNRCRFSATLRGKK
jgi:hypothetical protein